MPVYVSVRVHVNVGFPVNSHSVNNPAAKVQIHQPQKLQYLKCCLIGWEKAITFTKFA